MQHTNLNTPDGVKLEDISLVVPNGKVIALIGPENTSKDSILRAFSRDLPVFPKNTMKVWGKRKGDKNVLGCYWKDSVNIYDDPTCQAFLRSASRAAGGDREHYAELRRMTGLDDERLKVKFSKCSADERMKVRVCAALAGDPTNVILKNPMDGMSEDSVPWLSDLISSLAASQHAVLITTESLREARTLGADLMVFFALDKILGNCPAAATISGGRQASLTVEDRARAVLVLHACGMDADADATGGVTIDANNVRTAKGLLYRAGVPVKRVNEL